MLEFTLESVYCRVALRQVNSDSGTEWGPEWGHELTRARVHSTSRVFEWGAEWGAESTRTSRASS